MGREYLTGDLFRNFERKSKPWGCLRKQLTPEFLRGELIKSEIAAHRGKSLGVLFQACGIEQFFRKASARQVIAARIDLAEPAFVLPRTAADVNVPCGEFRKPAGKRVAVERGRLVKQ